MISDTQFSLWYADALLYFDEDSVLPATIKAILNETDCAVAGCKVASYEVLTNRLL